MNKQDFQGQSKYKFLVPIVYIISWISMLLGPSIFPILYNSYCMLIVIYLAIRSFILCGLNAQLAINTYNVLKNTKNSYEQDIYELQNSYMPIYHTFVIPNYQEPIQLLSQTLKVLSKHKKASSEYLVFLAMQKHQFNSQQKALQLVNKFKNRFLHISYTLHELQHNQHKGKASNVNWCAQNIEKVLKRYFINEQNVFVTVIDADSWVPQKYIQQIQKNIFNDFENRHLLIYQPPQIYTRNNLDVNVLIRTYDDMYSSMHASSLISCSGISFSLSNYTLSYLLVKNVGFWDTVQQAIGQDMHMTLKSMFKTQGKLKTVPIFIPFNQVNIESGNGSLSDIKAKFWQIQRHARGVADIGYCLNMIMKNKFNLKTMWMTISLIEAFYLPIVCPWPLISIFILSTLNKFELYEQKGIFSFNDLLFVIMIANIGTFVANLIYEVYKRRSTSMIYHLNNPHIIRILQGSIFYTINLLLMTVPSFIIGSFGNLIRNREYEVTKKNSICLTSERINKI